MVMGEAQESKWKYSGILRPRLGTCMLSFYILSIGYISHMTILRRAPLSDMVEQKGQKKKDYLTQWEEFTHGGECEHRGMEN